MKRKASITRAAALFFLFPLSFFLFSCHNDYTPKPQAYLRIDMPEHEYFLLDTMWYPETPYWIGDSIQVLKNDKPYHTFPFAFEANECIEWTEKSAPKGEVWVDLKYPQWDGVVFLTYKRLQGADDLRGQTDTSLRLIESHYQFASGVEEQRYENDNHHVYGTTYRLHGSKVASTYQFWVTDSSSNFLRGALYLNRTPNNDSLAPVLEYIQTDLDHLIETLRWR